MKEWLAVNKKSPTKKALNPSVLEMTLLSPELCWSIFEAVNSAEMVGDQIEMPFEAKYGVNRICGDLEGEEYDVLKQKMLELFEHYQSKARSLWEHSYPLLLLLSNDENFIEDLAVQLKMREEFSLDQYVRGLLIFELCCPSYDDDYEEENEWVELIDNPTPEKVEKTFRNRLYPAWRDEEAVKKFFKQIGIYFAEQLQQKDFY